MYTNVVNGDFPRFLRERRIEKKITQQALADAVGVTREAVVFWEAGKRKMTLENADKVFKALGISVVVGEAVGA